jgi:hypothetical protein
MVINKKSEKIISIESHSTFSISLREDLHYLNLV